MAEVTRENRALVVRFERISLVDRIMYREPRLTQSILRAHSPACCDCQPLDRHTTSAYYGVDALRLFPDPVKGPCWTRRVMTPFRFGNGQIGERVSTGNPVGEVTAGTPDNFDLTLTVEHDGLTAEMGENGKVEISLEIGARDESAEQPRTRFQVVGRFCPSIPQQIQVLGGSPRVCGYDYN